MNDVADEVTTLAKRCPKRMKNGPCGASFEGRCELGGICVWNEIHEKLRATDDISILDNVLGADSFGYAPYADATADSFIDGRKFVVTTEIEPPKGADLARVREFLANVKGVDAVNIVDNPMGDPLMSGLLPALHVLKYKHRPIYQVTCRDRNLAAIQSDLFQAFAAGVKDVLVLTGDYGVRKGAQVFDCDSTLLAFLLKTKFASGLDFFGRKIDSKIVFNVGVAVNPNMRPQETGLTVFRKKMRFADFAQTQAVFDPDVLLDFSAHIDCHDRTLVGVLPITSHKMALAMRKIPGVVIPDELVDEIGNDETAGVRRAHEMVELARKLGFKGVHVMCFMDEKMLGKTLKV